MTVERATRVVDRAIVVFVALLGAMVLTLAAVALFDESPPPVSREQPRPGWRAQPSRTGDGTADGGGY